MARRERLWLAIAYAPTLLVAWANGVFVWNHFYARFPYLHDSGWFSVLVYRAGPMPRSPLSVANDVVYYWGWHPSVLVSLASLASYLAPLDRIEWFVVFQAAIYVPLAFAVPLLVPKSERTNLASAALTATASFAFAFGGQVVSCMGYPHFEIFSAAGCAIMLAALAMGRPRLAWVGLAMSVMTREDGGVHAASFLTAVLVCDLTGRPFPIARKRVVTMLIVALVASGLLIVIQKKLFVSVDAWKLYLAGEPPYAHVTRALLAWRLSYLWTSGEFIWMPLVGAAFAALVRRDARYLLGWLATVPWFLLNFFALQLEKGVFALYTGFPFICSAFWVAAYGRGADRRVAAAGWRWPVFAAGALGLVSLFGLERGYRIAVGAILDDSVRTRDVNRSGLRSFADELRAQKLGVVRMDTAMTAFAIEHVRMEDIVGEHADVDGIDRGDAFAFYATGPSVAAQRKSPFSKCGHVPRTAAFFCTTPDRSLASSVVPGQPLFWAMKAVGHHARREGDVIAVDAAPLDLVNIGPSVKLPVGAYLAAWQIRFRDCPADAPMPHMIADVVHVGVPFAVGVAATRHFSVRDATVALEFVVTPELKDKVWDFRTLTGSCAFAIEGFDLAKNDP